MDELAEARRDQRREAPGAIVGLGKAQLACPEQWSVREQVLVAALDAGEGEVAAALLAELEAQFPGSLRVARLRGLVLEASGKSKEAAALYDEMIKNNPNGALGLKRKVCLLKSAGRLPEAIKGLSAFLEVFQSDAWKELAQLYVEAGELDRSGGIFSNDVTQCDITVHNTVVMQCSERAARLTPDVLNYRLGCGGCDGPVERPALVCDGKHLAPERHRAAAEASISRPSDTGPLQTMLGIASPHRSRSSAYISASRARMRAPSRSLLASTSLITES
jgi:tetratricopeptide (TPR) repeat protein